MYLTAVKIHAACGVVDAQAAVFVHARLLAQPLPVMAHTPECDPESGKKLVHGKRLCQIIVRPGVERCDLVGVLAAGGYHDYGHIAPRPYLFYDLDAVGVGKPKVKYHDLRLIRQSFHYCARSGGRYAVLVILRLHRRSHELCNGIVVLNDQYLCLVHRFLPPVS